MQIHEKRLNTWAIVALSTVLSLAIFVIYLLLSGQGIIPSLLKVGIIIALVNGAWRLTDRRLWRWTWLRNLMFSGIPNLNGRWKGEIHRDGDDSHEFVLEIRQTLTKIHIDGYSPSGAAGPSVTARLCSDDSEQQFTLVYTWACQTPNKIYGSPSGWFFGTSILKWLPTGKLTGHYYSGRTPHQTRGTSEFSFVSRDLKGQFADGN